MLTAQRIMPSLSESECDATWWEMEKGLSEFEGT